MDLSPSLSPVGRYPGERGGICELADRLECQDRFINLRFNGDLDIDIIPNRSQAGETESLIIFPLSELWMFRGFNDSL